MIVIVIVTASILAEEAEMTTLHHLVVAVLRPLNTRVKQGVGGVRLCHALVLRRHRRCVVLAPLHLLKTSTASATVRMTGARRDTDDREKEGDRRRR